MGKEEIARNEQFLLFPQCFLLNQKIISPYVIVFDIISLFAAELEEPKIGMWGKGLKTACCKRPLSLLPLSGLLIQVLLYTNPCQPAQSVHIDLVKTFCYLSPITRRQYSRLVQTEKYCRRYFKVQAISPFLTMFSTAICL